MPKGCLLTAQKNRWSQLNRAASRQPEIGGANESLDRLNEYEQLETTDEVPVDGGISWRASLQTGANWQMESQVRCANSMLLNRGGESQKNEVTLNRLVTQVKPVAMSGRTQTTD